LTTTAVCASSSIGNLGEITQVFPSLDTHHAMQVFHAIWLVDERGDHPAPYTLVSAEDVATGRWRLNSAVAEALGIDIDYAERHLAYYTRRLAEGGKYDLTIWPYHAMLGGIGHALVSAVEEAIFFPRPCSVQQAPTSRSRATTH
jgi:nicotinamidase-related amidase